ncbi:MAG: hypothetical protein RCO49_00700 [Rickettsia endosymbiont of Argas persicus]
MNILDRLISDNEKYKAQFKENKLFKSTVKLSKLVSKSTMFLYFRQQEVFE